MAESKQKQFMAKAVEEAVIDGTSFTLPVNTAYEDLSEHLRRCFSREGFEARKVVHVHAAIEGSPAGLRGFAEAPKEFAYAENQDHLHYSEDDSIGPESGEILVLKR